MTMINSTNLPSPTLSLKDSHTTAVQVAIRVRPLTESEQTQPRMTQSFDSNVIKTNGNSVTIVPLQKSFHFDHVFDAESAQDQVYTGVVSNLIDRVLDGYNVTILAYGQTSSGKTHTIMGSAGPDQEGIIPRAMAALFERLHMTAPSITTDSSLPPSPSSSCIPSPRSPAPPTVLRPASTIITNQFHGNNDIPDSSRRDSAPALLWRTLDKSPRHSVHVSFVEIYNEELVDLLNAAPLNERPPTAIREDMKGQIHWTGIKEVHVSKPTEVLRCLEIGTHARATGSTDMNAKSSRSHAIFTVTLKQEKWIPAALSASKSSDVLSRRESCLPPVSSVSSVVGMNGRPTSLKIKTRTLGQVEQQQQQQQCTPGKREDDGEWVVVHSKLHFVDLAGSERLKRTSAEGDRRKEGININAGLLALGNVISALASLSDTSVSPVNNNNNKKTTHVPYRDSKLTRMLQDSLGGNAITLMIACISPAERNLAETANTIKYAHRARNIKNKAGRNEAEDWMTNDNPEFLRSLITQLKSDIKTLKLELTHQQHQPEPATDLDIQAQLQQKIQDCEQGTHLLTQRHLQERAMLRLDIESLLQAEVKRDQLITLLEQKSVAMAHVMAYLQQQLDLQDTYINQLCNDNQEKTHQIQSARTDLQHMLREMAELGTERTKFKQLVEWMDNVKLQQEAGDMNSLVSFDELQRLHHLRDAGDLAEIPMTGILEGTKDKDMKQQKMELGETNENKSAALGKRLIDLDQSLQQMTTERDDLQYALKHNRDQLQAAQQIIEKQATALAHAQQQARETMDLLEQERKCSVVNDTTSLVAGLEDKIQVLERARQLDQQEHDNQLDAVMDDLEKSQEAYKQQSHIVVSLKQTIQNMRQRLDKTPVCPSTTLPNQHQQSGDLLQDHDRETRTHSSRNINKCNEENVAGKSLQLRPSASTPYLLSSASQPWSSSPAIPNQQMLDPLLCKPTHSGAKTAATPEMKEQLQQFTDQKLQLMMKILDMETQLRTQRAQFNSETDIVASDVMTLVGNNSRMERERKTSIMFPTPPRKLRSATSQPLISNNHAASPSPPLRASAPSSNHNFRVRYEIPTTAAVNDLGAIPQPSRSKRTSSSSSITFLSTGTQTTSSSSNCSTPQRTSSTHTTISSISSNDMMMFSNSSSSQQSTQTTADQYNKMIHVLQCQAQVAESNTRAHQEVIHKLERQLSRSESSVRDTKKQLEVLHKEKQAYTMEIKNLRSQVTQVMTQQKMCLDESGEKRKHLEIALEQERRLKEMAEKARVILENRMEVLMAKRNKFMCFY